MAAPPLYPDPAYFAQLVRAVMIEMSGPLSTTPRDIVVNLVRWVKSLRELDCEAFMGEEDAKIVGRWLRKIERSMDHIAVPAELRVDGSYSSTSRASSGLSYSAIIGQSPDMVGYC